MPSVVKHIKHIALSLCENDMFYAQEHTEHQMIKEKTNGVNPCPLSLHAQFPTAFISFRQVRITTYWHSYCKHDCLLQFLSCLKLYNTTPNTVGLYHCSPPSRWDCGGHQCWAVCVWAAGESQQGPQYVCFHKHTLSRISYCILRHGLHWQQRCKHLHIMRL